MTDRLKFEFRVLVSGVTVAPPPKGRTEPVYSIMVSEASIGDAKVYGRAAIRDVPEPIAAALAENLSRKRRFTLSVSLDEIEDAQTVLAFDEAEADRDARNEAGAEEPAPARTRGGRILKNGPAKRMPASEHNPAEVPGTCAVCGCTDEAACDPPCSWKNAQHTLCSRCVPKNPTARKLLPFRARGAH